MGRTNLQSFIEGVLPGADYPALHEWSIREPDKFWRALWTHTGFIGEPGARVIEPGPSMPETRFFPDATLSVVDNLLRGDPHAVAVAARDETGARRELTRRELRDATARCAAALDADGVEPGDRVAAWLPNGLEALIAMLGAASIGAVFSSASPDFGTAGVLDRFGQIEPKVLVAAPGYRYNGKWFDCRERLDQITAGLPSLRRVVVIGDSWDSYLDRSDRIAPRRFPFDHPWYVLYSSGTTGVPKCIVHRTGGVLLQHLKEHQLHCDVHPGDRVMYFTTTGWMMWNWLVSALASEATIVAYDGSPSFPSLDALFDIVDDERLTLLGVSAKFIDSLRKAGSRPRDTHRLDTLRTLCSTGSPLSSDGFAYVYDAVKTDVHLASISGGTDLCACFVAGDPTSPVHIGEIQRPALGMATDVFDDSGATLRYRPGVAGELVCTEPFPSMPLGFWGDGEPGLPDPTRPGPKYRAAYFERFPGVWTHGDFASWTVHGGFVIHGRSDATLNPSGVRIGTAEIYRAVEAIPDVVEAAVFGQQWEGDTRIVLLVRLAEGRALDGALQAELRDRIRKAATPRHVPAIIAQVDDLPRTRSNKLVELAIADAVNGREVRNTEALANPEALTHIAALPELRR